MHIIFFFCSFWYILWVCKFLYLHSPLYWWMIVFLLFLIYSLCCPSGVRPCLLIILNLLVLWSICLSSSFVHFRKGLEYLTMKTVQVFILLFRFCIFFLLLSLLLYHLWVFHTSFTANLLRTLLSILADLNNAVVCTISIFFFTICDFFTPVLIGSLSLESKLQQVSSGFQDSFKNSYWSLQCYGVYRLNFISDFQFFQSFFQTLGDYSKCTNYNWYYQLFHVP